VAKAVQAAGKNAPRGISVDSWGSDYVLVGKTGEMLSPPVIYRDPRHVREFERLMKQVGGEFLFAQTGILPMAINTLYHAAGEPKELLADAEAMLFIADYFNYRLTAASRRACVEISNASPSQIMDVRARKWSEVVIKRVGLPRKVFPPLVESGTVLGQCELAAGTKVVATCSHDTACAVAAVPAKTGEPWAYISSGTWSLVGVELREPIITARCRELGFTNELGLGGTVRLLKCISALYILQQCRAVWKAAGTELDYGKLTALAEEAAPLRSLIRPEAAVFGVPGDMPKRIEEYCRASNQPVPRTPGEFARCIYESLALLYRQTLAEVSELTGQPIKRVHIVGGGSRATLLNQLTADACGMSVIAGPVEATAMGNVLIQAQALGETAVGDIRGIVRESVSPRTFEPSGRDMSEAFGRFARLPSGG
jgi:rhamnulokinase